MLKALVIAFVTNTAPAIIENYITWYLGTNGVNRIYPECNNCTIGWPPSCQLPLLYVEPGLSGSDITCHDVPGWDSDIADAHKIGIYWIVDIIAIIGWIVIEILLLGFNALHASCRIASTRNFRLTPLNETRAFVALSFIRATFELGNPTSSLLGVDPVAKNPLQIKIETFLLTALYKLKILLLGILIKTIWMFCVPVDISTWLISHAATVSSCFFDVTVTTIILDQVELRASGIVTSVELFNDLCDRFLQRSEEGLPVISNVGKLQVVRAIGVAICKAGNMYPPMELLLRHSIQYFDLPQSMAKSSGFDDSDLLIQTMSSDAMDDNERHLVLCVGRRRRKIYLTAL
eukprot:SAG31_NODE_4365_length_3307_cov_10.960723_1_plen_347_part_00